MKLLKYLLLFVVLNANAQQTGIAISSAPLQHNTNLLSQPPACATDVLQGIKMLNPAFAQQMQLMNTNILNFANRGGGTLMIPVVVHIIHNNGVENIPDAQVIQGIQDLNDAFANTGQFADPNGVNTGIQFCLAQQDPNGQFTTGITRTVSTLTNMNAESEDLALKDLIRWDPTRYLNIWVVKEITTFSMGSGVAGYAYFPSEHGQPDDGIVSEAGYFGSSIHNSKVHIHEAGHYLGLYHTFEGGCTNNNCLLDGDHVCDTPPDNSTAAVICSANPNTCNSDDDDLSANNPFRPIANGGLGDVPDQFENYMDYGLQLCQTLYSQGQSVRMNAALTTARASLLQSNGCNSICLNPVNTTYTTSLTNITLGDLVIFDATNPTPGATYTWAVNGVPFSSNPSATRVFNNVGTFTVTLTGSNGDVACTEVETIIVHVDCNAQANFTLPSGALNPGATVTTTNTSTNATTYKWYLDGVLVSTSLNYSHQFNTAGGHNIYLIASNNNCADTSGTQYFTIGDCSLDGMNANWVFAFKKLHFAPPNMGFGGSPIVDQSQECTSTISDPDGNMLFFSDGKTVWDRSHIVMPNGTGLVGHASSTQGVLISPYPGNSNLYYVFTVDATENNGDNGFRYSIVDMTLNGGMGDVVATAKNILIRNNTTEKLTGTYHGNGRDIWITVATKGDNLFYAYLLTPAGIDTTPVVSQVGTATNFMLGGMKFSPDGNKMAAGMIGDWPWSVLIADFNKNSGEFINSYNMFLANEPTNPQVYSVEFSPDNSKLYVSFWQLNQIWQYNMAAGSNTAIEASKVRVDTYGVNNSLFGPLSLGIDGKIYVYSLWPNRLDVISNPNALGSACNYGATNINFALGQTAGSLQNIISGLDQPHNPEIAGPEVLCSGGVAHTYTIPYATPTDVAVWTYTGPGTFVNNGNNTATITTNNTLGAGRLTVILNGRCGITYDTLHVNTVAPQQVSLGNDTAFCTSLDLYAQLPFAHYLWNTTSTDDTITVTTGGTYWLQTTDINGCHDRDTILLVTNPTLPPINITASGILCVNGVVTLDAGTVYDSYEWNDGFPEHNHTIFAPGTYWVTATSGCTVDVDSITIAPNFGGPTITLTYNGDTNVCNPVFPIVLNAPQGFAQYHWQDNTSNTYLQINAPGAYWVAVTDANGCLGADTIHVGNNPAPFQVTYNGDTVACGATLPHLIYGPTGYAHYEWSNQLSNSNLTVVLAPGKYWLTVTDAIGCSATDTIRILSGSQQNISLTYNGDTIVCADELPFMLVAPPGLSTYEWQDGSGNDSLLITTPGTYWLSVHDSCSTGSDTIVVRAAINFELAHNGDTIACKNVLPFTLNAPAGYQQYFWQNGNVSSSIQLTSVGSYWVRVTDANGCTGIDTFRVADCTSINENGVSPVKFYPNPASDVLRIAFEGNEPLMLTLYSATGQIVAKQQLVGSTTINTAGFANGLYVVEVSRGQNVWREKLLVMHNR